MGVVLLATGERVPVSFAVGQASRTSISHASLSRWLILYINCDK